MDINAVQLFMNYDKKIKRLRKTSYTQHMETFRAENKDIIQAMLDVCDNSQSESGGEPDTEIIDRMSMDFSAQVFDFFAKRGKVKGTIKTELNLFMILYVFPAILLSENKNAKVICDSLRDQWNKTFNEKIDYTDFATLLGGFNDKLFGLF